MTLISNLIEPRCQQLMTALLWLLVLPVMLISATGSAVAQNNALDEIVVTVNDEPITETTVQRNMRVLTYEASQAEGPELDSSTLRRFAIENAINFTLQRQFAVQNGIGVGQDEVDQRVHDLSEQAQIDRESFLGQFEAAGLNRADVLTTIERNLLTDRIVQRVIVPRVQLRDEEIERYRQANESQFSATTVEYDLSVIVISTPLGADAEHLKLLRELIGEIRQELRSGRDFNSVGNAAAQFDGIDSGSLGWVSSDSIEPTVIDAVSRVADGKFVGPLLIGSDTIYAVAQGRREVPSEVNAPPLHQFSLARIVLHASTEAGTAALTEELNNIRTNILQGGDFVALAKLHSHDIETKKDGGDLGWVSEDNLAFEYGQLLSRMQVGEISEVQQIGHSVFILQFNGVREADFDERIRAVIRNVLRDNKARNEQNNWIDNLRANASIDYKRKF